MLTVSHFYTFSKEGIHLVWALRSDYVYGVVLHVDLMLTAMASNVRAVILAAYTNRRIIGCMHWTEKRLVR